MIKQVDIMTQQHWLIIGIEENWLRALSHPIPVWGLKDRYFRDFQLLSPGDFIWMYVTKPVGGIVGIGSIKETYIDRKNLIWQEEIDAGHVIWPLRFRFQVLKILPQQRWQSERILINDLNIFWQQGFHRLTEKMATEIFKRAQRVFSIFSMANASEGASIDPVSAVREKDIEKIPEPVLDLHSTLQNQIAEIGKLQFYHTQLEYVLNLPGERKNLDVVWKREINGVPTFAFEVELSGMVEKAVDRLLFAFKQWNSKPRIIVPEEMKIRVINRINTAPREFATGTRIYNPGQISDLLDKKRQLRDIEKELGLY
ncbi:MAG: hypothetical protein NC913_07245 [Candidatus Omnitrophica bacterium]|nr:hypothetical protein [Candidatus Omnitrophota bacterium]